MKIGYPCINQTIGCKGDRTFRLKSYSEDHLIATVENNLSCLLKMLQFNVKRDILFFRITSDLVPFASHPICEFRWQEHFRRRLTILGDFIRKHDIRISMHPGQFAVINSVDAQVFERSVKELEYHIQVLDSLRLRASAKVQIHVGGVYGDKERSMRRFLSRYQQLDEAIRRRLVIENDGRLYNLRDCLQINAESGIPVLFDVLHHSLNNSGETIKEAFELFTSSWKKNDGVPMVDYSTQLKGARTRRHADTIDLVHFKSLLEESRPFDFDIMLEIKDKETSALKAMEILRKDSRLSTLQQISAHKG